MPKKTDEAPTQEETEVWPRPKLVLRHIFGQRVELDAVNEPMRPPKLVYPLPGMAYDAKEAREIYNEEVFAYKERLGKPDNVQQLRGSRG